MKTNQNTERNCIKKILEKIIKKYENYSTKYFQNISSMALRPINIRWNWVSVIRKNHVLHRITDNFPRILK